MNITKKNCVQISDLLQEMEGVMGLPYETIEKMAFDEGVYPIGYETFIDSQDEDGRHTPLTNAIRKMIFERGIYELYITEE